MRISRDRGSGRTAPARSRSAQHPLHRAVSAPRATRPARGLVARPARRIQPHRDAPSATSNARRSAPRYAERLREILPPRTPIIRLSERRFAVLVDVRFDVGGHGHRDRAHRGQSAAARGRRRSRFSSTSRSASPCIPSHADDAATLFRRAELALKEARENELAFDIYRPDATQQQAALWKFETELQSAVAKDELEVYFQPKVEIATRRVCGVEALVRWRTQSGSFVPASDSFRSPRPPAAIVPMTWLVFDRIVEQLKEWARVARAVLAWPSTCRRRCSRTRSSSTRVHKL